MACHATFRTVSDAFLMCQLEFELTLSLLRGISNPIDELVPESGLYFDNPIKGSLDVGNNLYGLTFTPYLSGLTTIQTAILIMIAPIIKPSLMVSPSTMYPHNMPNGGIKNVTVNERNGPTSAIRRKYRM